MAFSNPSISPDHKKILMVGSTPASKNNASNLNIYTVNIDGSELTQLTYHPGIDCSPIWSADGKSIYFISERGNKGRRYQIWKMEYRNNL
jgi:Tol biopolymer transport system component